MPTANKKQVYGLLIDYEFCTGCHTCEVACKQENKLPHGQWGIKLAQYGPTQLPDGKWDYTYYPLPTVLCDLCQERAKAGKEPSCVKHCQASVMTYGPLDELVEKMKEKPQMVLFSPA